MAIIIYLLS